MAKAIANCTCRICGKEFIKTAFKRNRTEADNWREWAEDYFDECSECYTERRKSENEKLIESLGLPAMEMKGSEKQIIWATEIKIRCEIAMNELREEVAKETKNYPEDECEAAAEKMDAIEKWFRDIKHAGNVIQVLDGVKNYEDLISAYKLYSVHRVFKFDWSED